MAVENTSGKILFIFCGSVSAPVEFSVGKLHFELSEAFFFFYYLIVVVVGAALSSHARCKNGNRAFCFKSSLGNGDFTG